MDRMVIQHTTGSNNNNNHHTSTTIQRNPATASQLNPSSATEYHQTQVHSFVDQFSEITDFVKQLYKELVAQNKPHSFNDFSCIFCESAYFELDHLIGHLDHVHRHQVQNGTFQLQPNFEEVIRARILQGSASYQHQQQIKMESLPPAGPGQVYQCAKCFGMFENMDQVTAHLSQCSMTYNYQQQAPGHQQQQQQPHHLGNVQQAQQSQSTHHHNNQQHQLSFKQNHQQLATGGAQLHSSSQSSHYHQASQQQQPPQHLVPVIETPTTVPIRHEIYGCARCGLRFRVVRELVMHLHMCVVDTFRDKAQYLTPDLWLQAPEGQHIVINEPESNTTLNTTGLWLMSNDVVSSPDIVSKGFWVMPPNNTSQTLAGNAIKSEPDTPAPSPAVIPQSLDDVNQIEIPYNEYQIVQQQQHAHSIIEQQQQQQQQLVNVQNTTQPTPWKKQPQKPKTVADENKRKRGGRAKAAPKNNQSANVASNNYIAQQQSTSNSGGSSVIAPSPHQPQQQQQSISNNKYVYMNGDLSVSSVDPQPSNHTASIPASTKRKRNEPQVSHIVQPPQQQQLVQEYLDTHPGNNELIDLDASSSHNYIISDFNQNAQPTQHLSQVQEQSQQHHNQQTQHIITKDGLLYEQLDYGYPATTTEPVPIKIESSYILQQSSSKAVDTVTTTPPQTRAAPQQHFKKKMQQQARSTTMLPKQQAVPPQEILQSPAKRSRQTAIAKSEPIEPETEAAPPQLLAIIANPDDLEDLSHLDKPIVVPQSVLPLRAKHTDYIESYCSFLKSRTHK